MRPNQHILHPLPLPPRHPLKPLLPQLLNAPLLNPPLLTRRFCQSGKDLQLREVEARDVNVAVCGCGGGEQDADDGCSDVGEEGELAGDGAGVVERGGVGGEVEAEEGVGEAPGLVSVSSPNSSAFGRIPKEIKNEEAKERKGAE